jgi:hypothetical protein
MNGPFERKRVSELRLDVSLLRAPRYVLFVLVYVYLSTYSSVLSTLPLCTCSCLVQFYVHLNEVLFFLFFGGKLLLET